jgi:hypothetical protein
MASYSPIGNTEIDPDSPLTSSLFTRLRDNPLAIQQGDPTAPRIATAALADLAVTTAKLGNQSVTAEKLADDSVGPQHIDPLGFPYDFDGNSGYTRLVSGMLLQWIKIPPIPADTTDVLDWRTPFLSAIGFVIAGVEMPSGLSSADNAMHVVSGYTLTQVEVRNEGFAGDNAQVVGGWVIAIGV